MNMRCFNFDRFKVSKFLTELIVSLKNEKGCDLDMIYSIGYDNNFSKGSYPMKRIVKFLSDEFGDKISFTDGRYKLDNSVQVEPMKLIDKFKVHCENLAEIARKYNGYKKFKKVDNPEKSQVKKTKINIPTETPKKKYFTIGDKVFFMNNNLITQGIVISVNADNAELDNVTYIIEYNGDPAKRVDGEVFNDLTSIKDYLLDNIVKC